MTVQEGHVTKLHILQRVRGFQGFNVNEVKCLENAVHLWVTLIFSIYCSVKYEVHSGHECVCGAFV